MARKRGSAADTMAFLTILLIALVLLLLPVGIVIWWLYCASRVQSLRKWTPSQLLPSPDEEEEQSRLRKELLRAETYVRDVEESARKQGARLRQDGLYDERFRVGREYNEQILEARSAESAAVISLNEIDERLVSRINDWAKAIVYWRGSRVGVSVYFTCVALMLFRHASFLVSSLVGGVISLIIVLAWTKWLEKRMLSRLMA